MGQYDLHNPFLNRGCKPSATEGLAQFIGKTRRDESVSSEAAGKIELYARQSGPARHGDVAGPVAVVKFQILFPGG